MALKKKIERGLASLALLVGSALPLSSCKHPIYVDADSSVARGFALGWAKGKAVEKGNISAFHTIDGVQRVLELEAGRSNIQQNVYVDENHGTDERSVLHNKKYISKMGSMMKLEIFPDRSYKLTPLTSGGLIYPGEREEAERLRDEYFEKNKN